MRINAVIAGDESEVDTEPIAAQAVQPGMLLYLAEHDDEVQVVIGEPRPFQQQGPGGRPERWVSIDVVGADEPVIAPAAAWLDVVFGTEAADLQPMLEEDLYQSEEEEALARNGLCHEQIPSDEGTEEPEEGEEPVWCGRPADPKSFYRLCTDCDVARQQQSEAVVSHGFGPTYAVIASLT